jgi:transposase
MKKPGQSKKTSTKRHFSSLFKQQALERADKDGVAQAATDLGITPSVIYNWRHSHAQRDAERDQLNLIRAENAKLKRELQLAQDDIAFLKKAAAYFAKPQK